MSAKTLETPEVETAPVPTPGSGCAPAVVAVAVAGKARSDMKIVNIAFLDGFMLVSLSVILLLR